MFSPYTYVECDNPYDVRPAVGAIMHGLEAALPQTRPDQPVVILLGGAHNRLIDPALAIATMRALQRFTRARKIDFAAGLEIPFSLPDLTLSSELNMPFVQTPSFRATDPHGQRALKTMLAYPGGSEFPLSDNNVRAFCHNNSISTRFNDLGTMPDENGDFMLAPKDPYTGSMLHQLGFKTDRPYISPVNGTGFTLRDLAFSMGILSHAKGHNKKIYLQIIDSDHVTGEFLTPYAQSLPGMLDKQGAMVLPVVNMTPHTTMLPLDTPDDVAARTIFIEGLSQDILNPHVEDAGEREFIDYANAQSGGEVPFLESSANRAVWKNIVSKLAPMWVTQAQIWAAQVSANPPKAASTSLIP